MTIDIGVFFFFLNRNNFLYYFIADTDGDHG